MIETDGLRRWLAAFAMAVLLAGVLAGGALAGTAGAVTFEALPAKEAGAVPQLSERQAFDLALALRLREQGVVPGEGPRGRALARLEKGLAAAGVDVARHAERPAEAAAAREAARRATNPALHGETVAIAGFAIPGPDGVFWLVPTYGMCAHVPAPPPNRMIRVETAPARVPRVLHTPVEVTGRLEPHESRTVRFVLDGPVELHAAWRLSADAVAPPPPGSLATLVENGMPPALAAALAERFGAGPRPAGD